MTEASGSSLRALLREPLVHFVLLAGLLFGLSSAMGPGENVIEITQEQLEWRIFQAEAQEGRTLTEEERALVRERYIDERVLVLEARALGLEEDERIDDILIQKMLHVLSGDVIQPTGEELAAYYQMNLDRYTVEESVTVDEVVVAPGAGLPGALLQGTDPDDLDDGVLVADRVMSRLSFDDLAQIFGDESAETVFGAEEGEWVDAYESVRGQHWFRIRERSEATVQPLEVVREAARLDWIAEQEDRRLLARVAELRAGYEIRLEAEEGGP